LSELQIIHHHLHHWPKDAARVILPVPRSLLAKRRWRGVAADGAEFGFDLEHALDDGDVFFQTAAAYYAVEQQPETVLEISLPRDGQQAARLGWLIGNLHFLIEVTASAVRVADDPALRQLCEREQLHYEVCERVFHPLSGGHSHGHHEH
jgi:urease accessory protein